MWQFRCWKEYTDSGKESVVWHVASDKHMFSVCHHYMHLYVQAPLFHWLVIFIRIECMSLLHHVKVQDSLVHMYHGISHDSYYDVSCVLIQVFWWLCSNMDVTSSFLFLLLPIMTV